MLQYLLNASAIWLISLVLFDLFLRRESYHNYNRFYLLFTFLLGALFPLVQWQGNSKPLPATLQKPVDEVIIVKQNVIAATTHASTFDWQQWLFIIYITSAAIAVVLLLIETAKLITLYRSGKRSKQDTWTIIETGKDHAPFSFMNALFICSRQQYNNDEWNMILIHEKRHTALFHFTDLLLMQLAHIVFWFHPLVYVYNKRLLLVHEYQADKASGKQPQVYGKFLVEQALLQAAPTISHSFNRSPIKKRILMLTYRSSAASRLKMIVFIPLIAVSLLCFTKNSLSQKKQGKYIYTSAFGLTDTSIHKVTYRQMLANPVISCINSNARITSFDISFVPKGKDFFGPFNISGSSKITGTALKLMQQLNDSGYQSTRVFVENIHANDNGTDINCVPTYFVARPK
jgi:hypothetical protein